MKIGIIGGSGLDDPQLLSDLNGREKLNKWKIFSMVSFEGE